MRTCWWRRTVAIGMVPLTLAATQAHPEPRADLRAPAAEALRLPVGDGRWSTTGPRKGWVYVCPRYGSAMRTAHRPSETTRARQPWFSADGQWYFPGRKPVVTGDEHHHDASLTVHNHGNTLTVTTASLPLEHGTGIFPIGATDIAYQYDRNPNTIRAVDLTFQLQDQPAAAPRCVTNQVGVMLTGPLLLSALDAAGRDAGAWEVQDRCAGHPEAQGTYHYHTASACGTNNEPATEIIGWALDGNPITGARTRSGRQLMTADLDECHGTTGLVRTTAGMRERYHYVMTADYPYSVGCFRGTPARPTEGGRSEP